MGVRYFSEGPKRGFFITCVAKSMIRPELMIRRQKYLGCVPEKDAHLEYRQLSREVKTALLKLERGEVFWRRILEGWRCAVIMNSNDATQASQNTYNALMLHTSNWLNVPVDKITTLSFQMVINEMEKNQLSRGRIRAVKSAVNVVFEWAILNKLIPPTTLCPTKGARFPKETKKEKPVLNSKQIKYLLTRALAEKKKYFPIGALRFKIRVRRCDFGATNWKRHFCREIGVPEIPFHGTRACFATLCLNRGVPLTKLMAVGGWDRLSSVQHYTRLVGTDVEGVTDGFNILPKLLF